VLLVVVYIQGSHVVLLLHLVLGDLHHEIVADSSIRLTWNIEFVHVFLYAIRSSLVNGLSPAEQYQPV
jgi:hypothetical protein